MKFTPHPFQKASIAHAVEALRTRQRTLYAAPTGCGKSVIELCVQEATGAYIVTPRAEIVSGMLDKLGCPDADPESVGIWTPVRLRNMLLKGAVRQPPALIFDETHHHNADTWQQLDLLTGLVPSVGYTATPYRGSPRSTRELLEHWGEAVWLITVQEAAESGYISIPRFSILPLVDDDIIDVAGGDFEVTSIDSVTVDRLGDMAEHARAWYSGAWDVPTVFALPSSECCRRLQQELAARNLPAATVSADTPRADRAAIFDAVKVGILALLHINIVSEGVDLPLRRLVDLAPTLSPVKWVQQLGRITRPSPAPPEYVGTNRNLFRHAYALDGAVPVTSLVAGEAMFPPQSRPHTRVLGLEAIGRFKPEAVKLLSGARAYVYALSAAAAEGLIVEYCCVVHPTMEPVWASKVNTVLDGTKQYGAWRPCDAPADVRGFSSRGERELSPKQRAWWERCAHRYGLDSTQEVTRKNFTALPVLSDLGVRLT